MACASPTTPAVPARGNRQWTPGNREAARHPVVSRKPGGLSGTVPHPGLKVPCGPVRPCVRSGNEGLSPGRSLQVNGLFFRSSVSRSSGFGFASFPRFLRLCRSFGFRTRLMAMCLTTAMFSGPCFEGGQVAAALHDGLGDPGPCADRIDGDRGASQGQTLRQQRDGGNLVRLVADRLLAQHRAPAAGPGEDRMQRLAPLGADMAAPGDPGVDGDAVGGLSHGPSTRAAKQPLNSAGSSPFITSFKVSCEGIRRSQAGKRRGKSMRCSPHGSISTKSSMPPSVARSTTSRISPSGHGTRHGSRGSFSAEKRSRREPVGWNRVIAKPRKSTKPLTNHTTGPMKNPFRQKPTLTSSDCPGLEPAAY